MVNGVIRVAYPGNGQHHKGYSGWQALVSKYEAHKKYNFFHLGLSPGRLTLRHRDVESSDDELSPMTVNLRETLVDVAVICPIWPETFNIIAHEAYAAGCFIVTCEAGGNVPKFVEKQDCGIVLKKPEDVLEYFGDWDQVARHVQEFRERLKTYPRLEFNIDLISNFV